MENDNSQKLTVQILREMLTTSIDDFLAQGGKLISRYFRYQNHCCALTTLCYRDDFSQDNKSYYDHILNKLNKLFPQTASRDIDIIVGCFICGFDDRSDHVVEWSHFKEFTELGEEFRRKYLLQ